jgi:hypothetical protein
MDGISLLMSRILTPLLILCAGIAFIGLPGCSERPIPVFDGERAFRDLERQCEFGPRVPGTEPHRKMEEWLLDRLTLYADKVYADTFSVDVGLKKFPEFRNYIAKFNTGVNQRILLCAHYDTRPVAELDPDTEKRDRPITGANDGASGVAVLLEMARLFHELRPAVGVDMVFFDGEDYGEHVDHMLFGSRRFAVESKDYRPLFGILLDMVGDRDLKIYQEIYSIEGSPETVKRVWDLAGAMGFEKTFVPIPRYAVLDDHVPLLQSGIRCINIIDFEYPYWHTSEDTPDKCSDESLKVVGEVILRLVYEALP